jgi:tRNA(His) 5'-end guanylyltransferase
MIDSLGDRMKRYEAATRTVVTPRTPIIIRVDGKSFHTYTRPLKNKFDPMFRSAMVEMAIALCREIQGAQFAFTHSDEVSVLVHPYKRFTSQAWFDGQVQKIVSVSASIAAGFMTAESPKIFGTSRIAQFDSRVFVLPEHEVCNYFIWRQKDCIRNSINTWARIHLLGQKCHGKTQVELLAMCEEAGGDASWHHELAAGWKHGCEIRKNVDEDGRTRWCTYESYLLFGENRGSIDKLLSTEEEEYKLVSTEEEE